MSHRYSCGDLIFEDSDPLSKLIVQRQNLNCESPIETAYYNVLGRKYSTDDICYHCGEGCSKSSNTGFLLRHEDLEKLNATDGKTCYPICLPCFNGGKKVEVYKGRKRNLVQARKEQEAKKAKKND